MLTGNDLIAQIDNLTVQPNSLALWGLGQMGLVVKGADGIIYIDPCLSYIIPERAYPPPLQPEQITHAAYVLTSHEHIDHFDPDTVGAIANAAPHTRFVATGWCLDEIDRLNIPRERVIVPPIMQPITLENTSIRLTAIPAAHYEVEVDPQKGQRWLGFWLEWNGVTLYFGGDTIIFDGYLDMLKKLPPADIAMLPVNGRDWFREQQGFIGNLHPAEAALLAKEFGWQQVIAGHNDLVPANTIPMGNIAQGFSDYAPGQPYKILQPGELYLFAKG